MIRYRPEIDGLRAFAVLGVFFYHLNWPVVKGGWLGVDVFFVISGYLICSLLLKELESTGRISFSSFYLRRTRRILPALLGCLIGSFPIALLFSNTPFFSEYIRSVVAAFFSFSNIFFWQHADYFALDSHFVPLLHTWSLGVEEQFYLLIPAFFALLGYLSRGSRRAIWLLFAIGVIGSFVLCRYGGSLLSLEFRFYMLPTRMWELGMGTFVALALHKRPQIRNRTIVHEILALLSIAFLVFVFSNYTSAHFGEPSLFAVAGTIVFLLTASESTIAGKALSIRPVRFIGNISYSLYLWHWPIIVLWNILQTRYNFATSWPIHIVIILAATAVATLSWKYIETPFRRKSNWKTCLRPLTPLLASLVMVTSVGFISFDNPSSEYLLSREGQHTTSFKEVQSGQYQHFGPTDAPPQFILLGDSHAQSAMPLFTALAERYGVAGLGAASGGVRPIPNIQLADEQKGPFVSYWYKHIQEKNIPHVVFISSWERLYREQDWKHLQNKRYTSKLAKEELNQAIRKLLEAGHHVWIMRTVPQFDRHPVFMTRLNGQPYSEIIDQQQMKSFVHDALDTTSSPRLHVLDPWPYLTTNGALIATRGKDFLYFDKGHLTKAGAMAIKDMFTPLFETIPQSKRRAVNHNPPDDAAIVHPRAGKEKIERPSPTRLVETREIREYPDNPKAGAN